MDLRKLQGVIPSIVLEEIPSVMNKFNIATPLRLSHFISQCAHESGNFTRVKENLSYSDVNRIVQIFRSDADINHDRVIESSELEHAKNYVNKPEALANFVYANQNGNGNEAGGDGYLFCGRGYIQLTGRANYTLFDDFVSEEIVKMPGLVATKYPLLSAGWFFSKHGLNAVADEGSGDEVVKKITRTINGGLIGISERIVSFNKFYNLLK